MTNRQKMERAIAALEDIFEACGSIKDAGACDKCPLKHFCIEDTTVDEFCDSATKGMLVETFGFADDVEEFISEEDYIYDLADRERKGERDELYD